LILAVVLAGPAATGAELEPRVLEVSPSPEPVPALGYRLLPLESDLKPGDAAPVYLRLMADLPAERLRELGDKPLAWLNVPIDEFPEAEARAFVNSWRPKLEQIAFGARRATCDWGYTLPEQSEHSIEINLADIIAMRNWARLLAVDACLKIVDHQEQAAVRTIETWLAFSRHIAEGPFLINALVGIGSAWAALERVDDLLAQPEAPNLYWSLTALPRPLIGLRKALAIESQLCERILPEMTGLDRARTDGEWDALLARFHARLLKLAETYKPPKPDPRMGTLAGFKQWVLPEAREYLRARDSKTDRLNDSQTILLYFGGKYHDLYDDVYKAAYLPFAEARPVYARGQRQLQAVKDGPLWLFSALMASVESCHRSQTRLDRKVAALRVVEALRLHAGAEGRLPRSLEEIKVVPVPEDPFTGHPFDYRLDGDEAILTGPMPKGQEKLGLEYRITLRR
jgi:hypothetical protein